MLTEDLSFVAEALLALCEKDRQAPCYSEAALDQKLRRDAQREPLAHHLLRQVGHDDLLRHECEAIMASSRLTLRQSEVLQLRLEGWTFEEIGRANGSTKQGAQRVFVQALKKLARALRVYPYAGLSEVYRLEVRRGRPPSRFGRMDSGRASRGQ